MVSFQSSENRERFATLDHVIETTDAVLHDPSVDDLFPKIEMLQHIFDKWLYIPNFKDGIISPPTKHRDEESIPLFALYDHEKFRASSEVFNIHPVQREAMSRYFAKLAIYPSLHDLMIDSIEEGFSGLASESLGMLTSQAAATTLDLGHSRKIESVKSGRSLNRRFRTKPIVLFSIEHSSINEYQGIIGAHELTHVTQYLTKPILQATDEALLHDGLAGELEAYHVSSLLAHHLYEYSQNPALYHNAELPHEHVEQIETLRSNENKGKQNPFTLTPALKNLMYEVGINFGDTTQERF